MQPMQTHQPHRAHQPAHQPAQHHAQHHSQHQLLYAPQCPNCMRFVGALDRTPARGTVAKVDVNSLSPEQCRHVTAVPTLVLNTGTVLVGTQAFDWLKQFEGQLELDSYTPGRGSLPFSDFHDDQFALNYSQPYGPFEPVK